MKTTIFALALLATTATAAYAGDKNAPQTGCDKMGAWCLSQRGEYQKEADQREAARKAAQEKAAGGSESQTSR